MKKRGGLEFGEPIDEGYEACSVAYIDYEYATIFSSEFGTYAVATPMLNVFTSSGGLDALGAPIGNEYLEDGFRWQEFENGILSCEYEEGSGYSVGEAPRVYLSWSVHVQTYGTSSGSSKASMVTTLGTTGESKRLEAVSLELDSELSGSITYRVHCQTYGWTDWASDGELAGTTGESKRLEAVQIELTGELAEYYDVYYRVHCQTYGWLDWAKNGETAGTTGLAKRAEAIEIKLVPKNGGGSSSSIDWVERIDESEESSVLFNVSEGYSYSALTLAFAGNEVNSTSFRESALTTFVADDGTETQYCAYYDIYGTVVLAERTYVDGSYGSWTYRWTSLVGNITDAHDSISIAVDGDGFLHVALSDHSTGDLLYAKSTEAGSLIMEQSTMIGSLESSCTYPEFYVQPSGDLLFLYRNGGSGNGNVVLNQYSVNNKTWSRLYSNLISGEGKLSAYWQACTDSEGRLHISWVWRETGDVSTNFNMSYMVSTDSSCTSFVNSEGESLSLPVTSDSDVLVYEIAQSSSLINQTSMTVDDADVPYIISYWRVDGVVQYQILRLSDEGWTCYSTGIRTTDFTLSGGGTKQLPCARPQILVSGSGDDAIVYVLFRDEERSSRASLATFYFSTGDDGLELVLDSIVDITGSSLEEWEPNVDIQLWKLKGRISLFVQKEWYATDGTTASGRTERVYVADLVVGDVGRADAPSSEVESESSEEEDEDGVQDDADGASYTLEEQENAVEEGGTTGNESLDDGADASGGGSGGEGEDSSEGGTDDATLDASSLRSDGETATDGEGGEGVG